MRDLHPYWIQRALEYQGCASAHAKDADMWRAFGAMADCPAARRNYDCRAVAAQEKAARSYSEARYCHERACAKD